MFACFYINKAVIKITMLKIEICHCRINDLLYNSGFLIVMGKFLLYLVNISLHSFYAIILNVNDPEFRYI